MIWFGAVAAFASLWLLGALTLAVAGVKARGGADALAADFAAGTAVLSFVGTAVIATGFRLSLVPFYALIAGLGCGAVLRRSRISVRFQLPRDRVARALLALAGLALAVVLLAATRDRLWWDGWAIWSLKARVLFVEGTLPPAFLEPGGAYAFTHLDYPLAVPLVKWWVYRHAGVAAPALASFTGAIWFALLPLLLWGALRPRAGERIAALAALGMAVFWPIAFYATGGTADVVVAFALLGALVELERAMERSDRAALWRCGVFLALGALAKNEGLAIALVALVAGVIALARAGERRAGRLAAFGLPLLALAPWRVLVWSRGLDAAVFVPNTAPAVLAERVPLLLAGLGAITLSGAWLPVPFLACLGLAAMARRRLVGCGAAWTVLGGYFAVVCAAYLFTPHDPIWLIQTSLPRVLGVFVPALVAVALLAAGTPGPTADRAGLAERVEEVVARA